MFKERAKLIPFLLVISMIFTSLTVFAQEKDYVVEISGEGVKTELKLSLDDLKNMPAEAQIDEEYIYYSKAGEKSVHVKGVSLAYVLKELAGVTFENALVNFKTSDDYSVEPQYLQDIFNDELKYVLAYEVDGQPIDKDDNPDNDEIIVYRKPREENEFGTVIKLVVKITVGEAIDPVEATEPADNEKVDVKDEVVEVVFTDITEEYEFAKEAISGLYKRGIIEGVGDNKYAPEREFTRAEFCKIMVESLGYELVEYKDSFIDVDKNDWFAPYVQTAFEKGLFDGYDDGSFRPNQPINRQEIAAVAGRGAVLAGIVGQAKMDKFVMEKTNYSDKELVPDWAANEVAWLEAQGVFDEIAQGQFQPKKVVNRAEAAVVIYNTLFK